MENNNDTQFQNTKPIPSVSFSKILGIGYRMITKDRKASAPTEDIPISMLSKETLDTLPNNKLHIMKLGHSSILLKVYGEYWLIDPVFSKRASPVSFAGPKRFHPLPISSDELPPIDRVLISHNHYDHLDKTAIKKLSSGNTQFMVPIGVDANLKKWGVAADAIETFEWWQELSIKHANHPDNTLVAFTPAQHFSGRGIFDGNKSLWGSWVIKTQHETLFFSGDTGYFKGFKTIGEKYGPFNLTFIETGAYDKGWSSVHMFPKQAVQAHIDLRGQALLPIHNSTFDLAFHPWKEPLEKIKQHAESQGIKLITPIVGEVFSVDQLPISEAWWEKIK